MIWPKPDVDDEALEFLVRQPFAHRGLHDAAAGIPENTLAAFDRAIAAGVGIELDIQITREGDAVVFHDETLERLTTASGPVALRNREQLNALSVGGTDQRIMTLHDTLIHIRGRVPVLIEAKTPSITAYQPLCFAVRRALEGYRGGVAVMSFNPEVTGWFARHHPKIVRGLVMTRKEGRAMSRWNLRRRMQRQLYIWRARPHFLAYDIAKMPSRLTKSAREAKLPVLSWTVRTEAEHALAAATADQIIFEGAVPAAPGPEPAA